VHVDADTLPLLKQQQLLCWRWIFWSTAAFSASGAGYFGAKLHCIKRGRATLLCAALKLKQ